MLKATPRDHLGDAGDITYGTALERDAAERDRDVPGTFVYTPAAGPSSAPARPDAVGRRSRRPTPSTTTTATTTVTINVTKATPTITWANPADITYGTALGATQLNATADVPGTFVYTPAAGTVLNAGAGPDAVGDLHADRHASNYTPRPAPSRSTCSRRRR